MQAVEWFDPIHDPRWIRLVAHHAHASVFQSPGWLTALARTYGYEPVGLGVPDGGVFRGGLIFCRVESRLTGKRLVSLPFSDYCDPLVDDDDRDVARLLEAVAGACPSCKYVELRPRRALPRAGQFAEASRYVWHRLDLTGGIDAVARGLHKNHVVRRIRRSEREKLAYRDGREELLASFYALVVKTRRRHGLPPQPIEWFRAILECLPDEARIRIAFKDDVAIAGIMTLCHGGTMMYKYGAADAAMFPLGGMQLLLWTTLQEACARGCAALDLGRSSVDSHGEIAFKDHWGAQRRPLVYLRRPAQKAGGYLEQVAGRLGRRMIARLPDRLFVAAGRSFYRHAG
jgi:CelD/BcsL family acetyltransferase involved in cellulose biosynthesis